MPDPFNPTYGEALAVEAVDTLQVGQRFAQLVSGAPEMLRRKMKKVTVVMVLSYAVSAGACLALVFGLVTARSSELFAVFVMLGSGAVGIAAAVGLAMLCWSALVRKQLIGLEQEVAGVEMAHEVLTLVEDLEAEETRRELTRSCVAASDRRASEAVCEAAVGVATGLVRTRVEDLIERREERQRRLAVG